MHACMHVCMYVCMHAFMHTCTYACMHVRMYVCVYVCVVVPKIWEFSVWRLLHVTVLAPRHLRWLLDFWEICVLQK